MADWLGTADSTKSPSEIKYSTLKPEQTYEPSAFAAHQHLSVASNRPRSASPTQRSPSRSPSPARMHLLEAANTTLSTTGGGDSSYEEDFESMESLQNLELNTTLGRTLTTSPVLVARSQPAFSQSLRPLDQTNTLSSEISYPQRGRTLASAPRRSSTTNLLQPPTSLLDLTELKVQEKKKPGLK